MSESEFSASDRRFMRLALRVGRKGKGWTSPNPCVGAVVVSGGEVVGTGCSRAAGQRHAEYFALIEAGRKARGATLYTTLEPCCHFGRTPPCTEEIIEARIGRVVIALRDPNPLVNGGGLARLQEAGIHAKVGLCAEEAQREMQDFLKYITTGLPFVTLKLAMTLDGKIATSTGDSKWITGEAARRHAHRLRHEHDVVVVGVNTVLRDDPMLTVRHQRTGRNPHRIVLDSEARTPGDANVIRETGQAEGETIIVVSKRAPDSRTEALSRSGAKVVVAPTTQEGISLPWLMRFVGRKEWTSVLIEGGSELAASAVTSGIVDRVIFYVAPKLVGGRDAVPTIGGKGVSQIAKARAVRDWSVRRCGGDLIVEGYL